MAILRPIRGKTELLQALGLVSVFHSTLQYELAEVLKVLLSVPSRDARFLVSQMSFKATCSTIRGLAEDRIPNEDLRKELDRLLGQAQNVDGDRNRVLHSDWGVSLSLFFEHGAVRAKPNTDDLDHYEVHDPASINQIADKICAVVDAFAHYWPRLRDHLIPETTARLTLHRRGLQHREFLMALEPRGDALSSRETVGIPLEPLAGTHEFVVAKDGIPVGYVALSKVDGVVALNCVIDKARRGRGLGTDACAAVIEWARNNEPGVIAEPLDKPESRRLVEKLVRIGLLRPDPKITNRWLAT